jgi:hypothetical protein
MCCSYACPVNLKSPSTCTERLMITYYSPGISSVRWLRGYVCFGPLCIFLHAALRCTLQVKLRAVLIGVEVSVVTIKSESYITFERILSLYIYCTT